MNKPKTPRDIQVRHRLSGAALLGMREPMAPTMAIDAAPRAGDVARSKMHGSLYDDEPEPMIIDEEDGDG